MKGTFLAYENKNFSKETLAVIHNANAIITEYEKQKLSLTLRQLYYQFVARGLLSNTDKNYNRLGRIVNDGRMSGLISWTAIEDRTRNLRGLDYHNSINDALRSMREEYRIDMWQNQDFRPEVWIEKDALTGVIDQICHELRVNYFASRGYNSQSEQWRAGQRFARYIQNGQKPIIFHLGDHDPSGVDMTRDNQERLSQFVGMQVPVVRLALNMDQIEQYKPPPNPAKTTDSRASEYIRLYGNESWELDALDPTQIRDLIRGAINKVLNQNKWDQMLEREAADLRMIDTLIEDI